MNNIDAELSESLASPTNDADVGSSEHPFVGRLVFPHGFVPAEHLGWGSVAQSLSELLADEVAALAVRTINSEVLAPSLPRP